MPLSSAQKVGVGALIGGVSTIGASMALRYWADNKAVAAAPGQPGDVPIWWEHAPLIGILAGAAAAGLSYKLWGTEAAVAAGIAALIAGVAPEVDAWVTESRAEKDLEESLAPPLENGAGGGLRGSDAKNLNERLAALESALDEYRKAA